MATVVSIVAPNCNNYCRNCNRINNSTAMNIAIASTFNQSRREEVVTSRRYQYIATAIVATISNDHCKVAN